MKKFIWCAAFVTLVLTLSGQEMEFTVANGDEALMKWLVENEIIGDYYQIPPILHFTGDMNVRTYLDEHHYSWTTNDRLLSGYQPYETVVDSIETLAALYPDITTLIDLGPTTCHTYYLEGNNNYENFQYEVLCLKLSDNPDSEEDEPNYFYCGGIHAQETIGVEVTMHILTWLLENYGVNDDATNWIDNNQIWVVPVMNPDGYEVAVQEWHSYHRKNMRDNDLDGMPDFSTRDGVDLNRNFGYIWGNNGASSYPSSNIYHGPCEWSEIETIYMRDMIRSHKFWGGITYHSTGEWVIYPLGHIDGACSLDYEIMDALAQSMAVTIPQIDGTGHYTPVQASDFTYTCQGTMGDWAYSEERVFGFTIELNNASYGGYHPPQPYIDQIKEDNLQAALIMLDRINYACLCGHATDERGLPIDAIMSVAGVDDQEGLTPVEPFYCDVTTGRFERPLLPGTYQITFSADGYIDCVLDNVEILGDQITSIDPVLYGLNVYSCDLTITDGVVVIDWVDPGGFGYIVLSCDTPDGVYEPDYTGNFLREHVWAALVTDPVHFYKIQRVSR